jgi:hypothetical protein
MQSLGRRKANGTKWSVLSSAVAAAGPPATAVNRPSSLILNMPSSISIPAGHTQGQFTFSTKAILPQATVRSAVIVALAVFPAQATLVLTT